MLRRGFQHRGSSGLQVSTDDVESDSGVPILSSQSAPPTTSWGDVRQSPTKQEPKTTKSSHSYHDINNSRIRTSANPSPSSRLACAFQALKCSSRASEEDQLQRRRTSDTYINNTNKDSGESDSIPGWTANFEETTMTTTDLNSHDDVSKQRSNQVLLNIAASESLDVPFEDHPDEHDLPNNADDDHIHQQIPRRVPSDDTHDTPNTSNRDPQKPKDPLLIHVRQANESFDEYCQKHFNTPRIIHSKASLGDAITPLQSPAQGPDEDEDEPNSITTGRNSPSHIAAEILRIPAMDTVPLRKTKRIESTTQPTTPDRSIQEMVEEKKVADEDIHAGLTLVADQAKVTIGRQEVRAASRKKIITSKMIPKESSLNTTTSGYQSLKTDESSFSSVSSFAETAANRGKQHLEQRPSHQQGKLTPHPFFWRSHPQVTIRSYDFQHPQPTSRASTPILQKANFHILPDDIVSCAVGPSNSDKTNTKDPNESYLESSMLRNMWKEGQSFGIRVNTQWKASHSSQRHPQGPPTARSGAILQSISSFASTNLPRVFGSDNAAQNVA